MEISEIVSETYREFEMLAADPKYSITDTRRAFIRAEDVDSFAATLDMRFVNVVNQVCLLWTMSPIITPSTQPPPPTLFSYHVAIRLLSHQADVTWNY